MTTKQHEVGWCCPRCKLTRKEDGHDPCFGKLPGVKFACCGHGKDNNVPYIVFENNVCVYFDNVQCVYHGLNHRHTKPLFRDYRSKRT